MLQSYARDAINQISFFDEEARLSNRRCVDVAVYSDRRDRPLSTAGELQFYQHQSYDARNFLKIDKAL